MFCTTSHQVQAVITPPLYTTKGNVSHALIWTVRHLDTSTNQATAAHMAPRAYIFAPVRDDDSETESSSHGLGWTSDKTYDKIPVQWRIDSGHRGTDALAEFSIYFFVVVGLVLAMMLATCIGPKKPALACFLGFAWYVIFVPAGTESYSIDSGLDKRFPIVVAAALAVEVSILIIGGGLTLLEKTSNGLPTDLWRGRAAGLALSRLERRRGSSPPYRSSLASIWDVVKPTRKSSAVRVDAVELNDRTLRNTRSISVDGTSSGPSSALNCGGNWFTMMDGVAVPQHEPPPAFDELSIRERQESDVTEPPPAYVP